MWVSKMKDYEAFMFGAYEEKSQEMCKWINIKDRQPEEYGLYLTFYHEHIHLSKYIGNIWYNEWGGSVTEKVEYWQPLPELPEAIKG